jgi:nucleotide-binding universal stress UspA family protein
VQFVRNDPRSDLFSLGVMLYHFTTGARPFGNPSSVHGLRKRLYADPVPPRALRGDCPPWLQEILQRCLEEKPERRHQSAAQLGFDLQNPEQVVLTKRAEHRAPRGFGRTVRRWFAAMGNEPRDAGVTQQTARSPIVLAAVDVTAAEPPLLEAIRTTVERVVKTEPGARLACLAVMKTNRIGMDELVDADGRSRHVRMLAQLKHWALPVVQAHTDARAIAPHEQDARITFHVIEAPDPAAAIVEYARRNQVDHIVMGARSSSMLRRYLGSVSAQVAAQADCTVTVVRAPEAAH